MTGTSPSSSGERPPSGRRPGLVQLAQERGVGAPRHPALDDQVAGAQPLDQLGGSGRQLSRGQAWPLGVDRGVAEAAQRPAGGEQGVDLGGVGADLVGGEADPQLGGLVGQRLVVLVGVEQLLEHHQRGAARRGRCRG